MTRNDWLGCVALTAVIAAAGPAFAQQSAPLPAPGPSTTVAPSQAATPTTASSTAANEVGEVIVTARKISERLNDVPVSITAVTGAQLAQQGVVSPTDLERVVPGFTFQKSSYGVPVFTIRGIGLYDTFVGVSPTVTVYVDQAPLPYLAETQGAGLDLERLEVLKGPQGTLFGQNSTGGAINYIAAKPTKDLEAGVTASFGRFDERAVQGFVSGPLTDTLRARLSVSHEGRGDWQESESRPGDTLGQRDFTAARLLLDWTPTDKLHVELNLNGWYDNSDTQAAQFIEFSATRPLNGTPPGYPESFQALGTRAPAPKDARSADYDANTNLTKDDRFYQATVRADYDLTRTLTLTSISSYADYRALDPTDVDGTNFDNFLATIDANIQTVSQELRLAGELNPRIRFTVGYNYENDRVNDKDEVNYVGSNSGLGPFRYSRFANQADQAVNTNAAFGGLDLKLADTLTAQGGVRYTTQDRAFGGCLRDAGDGALARGVSLVRVLAGLAPNPAAPGACVTLNDANLQTVNIVNKRLDEDNVSWRVSLNWKPSSSTLIYGNVTKGFKAGSFSALPAVFASQLTPVTQESVLAYEGGFKVELLQNRLQLTGAGFYYDYTNKQILGFTIIEPFGDLPALQNIPKSSVRGAEFDATILPFRGLRVTAGVTYVDSRVDGHVIAPDPFSKTIDLEGEAFPSTPKFQFVSDAEYSFPLTDRLDGFVGGGVTARSATYAAFGRNPEFRINSYPLVDLRGGVESPGGKWRVQAWGRNIFNQFYLLNVSHLVDTVARTTGFPATYGVTISYRY